MPGDARDTVLNREYTDNQSFIQDCSTLLAYSEQSHKPKFGSHYQHAGPVHYKFSNPRSNNFSNSYSSHNHHSEPHFHSHQSSFQHHHTHSNRHSPPPNPVPRRDISTVTCYKCHQTGHYANRCPSSISVTFQSQPVPTSYSTPNSHFESQQPQPNRPTPVPRTSRPTRRVQLSGSNSASFTEVSSTPLNCFIDEDIVIHGVVNGIVTPIIIDSGAKCSLVSADFVTETLSPVSHISIHGISQIPHSVPVYEMTVELPTMSGVCRLAVEPKLPMNTVLLGTDFGKENILALLQSVKTEPQPVLTVTRAMQSQDNLATHVAEALHASEGGNPLSFDSISDFIPDTTDSHETEPVASVSPEIITDSEFTLTGNSDQSLLIPVSLPTLSFDGITKDQFKRLQLSDQSLQPLWEHARKGEKHFFIMNGILMCMTSTLNTISHALVVPQQLRHKVLVAAHEGLGHGGVNTTRSLLNKHFTWPGLANDIKKHVQSCDKCLRHTKSGALKVPLLEPEVISHRGEKLAIDIVGPLPTSKQKLRFILTAMELATGYPFAVAIRNYTAEETAKAILSIISILGAPIQILSDQGANFLSSTLNHVYKRFGIARIKTSPYHPQSNGRLERFHSTLKAMISKCITAKHDWPIVLDLVLYFTRNTPHSRHGFTPQELLFVKPTPYILSSLKSIWSTPSPTSINLPQFIADLDNMLSCQLHHVKKALSSKHSINRLTKESQLASSLKQGDIVFKRAPGINRCLEASWDGPFVICDLIPPVNCSIKPQGSKSKPKVVHLSQLKKSTSVN